VKVCWKWLIVHCKLSLGDLIKKDQTCFLDKLIIWTRNYHVRLKLSLSLVWEMIQVLRNIIICYSGSTAVDNNTHCTSEIEITFVLILQWITYLDHCVLSYCIQQAQNSSASHSFSTLAWLLLRFFLFKSHIVEFCALDPLCPLCWAVTCHP